MRTQDIFSRTLFTTSFDLTGELKKISCPTLIIHGDKDVIPLSTVEPIHAAISGSELRVIEECGHFPYVEKPDQLFSSLDAFLDRAY